MRSISQSDNNLSSFVTEGDDYDSLEEFVKKITDTGLVYLNQNILRLLTDDCQCVFLPGGLVVAAENKSGRLTNWVLKYTEALKKANENNME